MVESVGNSVLGFPAFPFLLRPGFEANKPEVFFCDSDKSLNDK